jgi:hypothetical protein
MHSFGAWSDDSDRASNWPYNRLPGQLAFHHSGMGYAAAQGGREGDYSSKWKVPTGNQVSTTVFSGIFSGTNPLKVPKNNAG